MLYLNVMPIMNNIALRDVVEGDLPIFFKQQLNDEVNYMAAFTQKEPANRDAFMVHWRKILGNESITIKAILFNGYVAGHVLSHECFGKPEVSYWIGKEYWGKGVATKALSEFLKHTSSRPLYARVAKDNVASIRVLEKCGFKMCGEDKQFSNARSEDIEELIMKNENC